MSEKGNLEPKTSSPLDYAPPDKTSGNWLVWKPGQYFPNICCNCLTSSTRRWVIKTRYQEIVVPFCTQCFQHFRSRLKRFLLLWTTTLAVSGSILSITVAICTGVPAEKLVMWLLSVVGFSILIPVIAGQFLISPVAVIPWVPFVGCLVRFPNKMFLDAIFSPRRMHK